MRSPRLKTQFTFSFLSSSNYLYKKQIHSKVETFQTIWELTSVIVNNQNHTVLGNNLKSVFISVTKWFKANLLSLNLEKTYCMRFCSKDITNSEIQIKYNNKIIANTTELKFHGLVLHNTLSWKSHTDM
jgi:hypothetical protein